MNLDANVIESPGKTLVQLCGEIDAYTAPKLREKLLPLTKQEGHKLEVDLDKVTYMDSTGLGVFISILKSANEAGSTMTLINLKERVLRLFKITGLDQIIDINLDERGVN